MNLPINHSAFASGTAYIDDQFVPIAEARIPIVDLGFLHSDATYDVAHVWQGSFFRLDNHLDRFQNGMQRLHMNIPHNRDRIKEILFECVKLGGLRDAYVEMICTRGIAKPGSRDPRECVNRFYAFAIPFVWIANPEKQKEGLHLIISRIQRIPRTSIDPTIKNYHWLDLVAGLFEAYDRGGETAILSDPEGNVIEGAGFNIFSVKQGKISTPAQGVLEGVTRKTVIEMSQMLNIPIEIRDVSAEEIRQADEVLRAQHVVLSRHTGRAVIEMADAQVLATERHHRRRAEAERFRADDRGFHDVEAGLETAVRLQANAMTQVVHAQGLMRFREPQLPRRARVLDRRQRARAGAAVVAGDRDQVGVGLGDSGRDRADAGLGDQLAYLPARRFRTVTRLPSQRTVTSDTAERAKAIAVNAEPVRVVIACTAPR